LQESLAAFPQSGPKAIQDLNLQLLRVHSVTPIFTRSFLSITAGSRTTASLNDLMLLFMTTPASRKQSSTVVRRLSLSRRLSRVKS
jgi:hypothetical protein